MKTLMDHCIEFYNGNKFKFGKLNIDDQKVAYDLWCTYAFCNMGGKNELAESILLSEIHKFISSHNE